MRLIKPAYTLFLKTGTYCNAGCITCPAGRKREEDKEHSSLMKPAMMERILQYVKQHGNIISATHHYYNEPTFNVYIAELIKTCHQHGVHCLMSTNGSNGERLMEVMEQGLTNLIFSVSGWTNEIHQRSHKGINIDDVKRSMMLVSDYTNSHNDFKGHPMFVRVSWHDYLYNRHEREYMKEYAEELGFTFTSYQTGLLPLEQAQATMLKEIINHPGERDLVTKLDEAQKLCLERKHWNCINQDRMLTIDGDGYLHNCCVKAHDKNRRGLLFETDLEEFNTYRKTEDTDCLTCKFNGHHIYAMQQYRTPLGFKTEVKKKAEDIWRGLNLGGIFPHISALRSQVTYSRPNKEV